MQIHFRFHHDDLLHAFFELRSISRHFGQFRALLKVLPVSELYFRATDLDFVHPVFLLKAFLAVRYGDNAGQNKAKKERPGGSRGQTGSRNMVATRFSDSATPTFDLSKSRPKYTTTSGFANPLQVWPRRLFIRVFVLRSILRPFGPFRAHLKVLPVSELYFRATYLDLVHPVFLLKAFLAVYVRYGDNTGQNKAKKESHGSSKGQTGSKNMAETSFSDSATPTSYLTSYTLWGLLGENFNISPL